MDVEIRDIHKGEPEKILRILKRCGLHQEYLPNGKTYVAVVEHKLVGTVTITDGNRICDLAVVPAYRGNGIARKLMGTAMHYASMEQGWSYSTLRVHMTNWHAIRLYWSMGFRIVGIRHHSFVMNKGVRIPSPVTERLQDLLEWAECNLSEVWDFIRIRFLVQARSSLRYTWRRYVKRMDIHQFRINQLYSALVMGSGEIPLPCIRDLQAALKTKGQGKIANAVRYYYDYMGDTQANGDRGTWTKRFAAWAKRDGYGTIPDDIAAMIGASVNRYTPKEDKEVIFEIVDRPNWRAGGFDDAGSCWFNEYTDTRDGLFLSGKGYAVKFYKDMAQREKHKGRQGLGRCWMYMDSDNMYIFNARGLTIQAMAQALAKVFDKTYGQCSVSCPRGAYVDGYGYVVGNEPLPSEYAMHFMDEAYGKE